MNAGVSAFSSKKGKIKDVLVAKEFIKSLPLTTLD
jgi:hypothetical protein